MTRRMLGKGILLLIADCALPVRLALAQIPAGEQAPELHPLLVLLVGTAILAFSITLGVWVARRTHRSP